MMSKTMKTLCAVTALGLTVSTVAPAGMVYGAELTSKDNQIKRLAGKNRFDTAVEISKAGYKGGSDFVVIANGLKFPDALCAAPLAKKYDAPILLSETNTLSANTVNEIKRLNPKYIFVVGGKGVISTKVESKLKSINKAASITRIGGKNRYETATLVAKKLNSNKVVVASGMNYADALSIAPIAAKKGMPILLTSKDKLPSTVKDYLKGKRVDKTFIIGQTGVVSNAVENELTNSERIGGKDRYETNVSIMKTFGNEIDFTKVYAAIGGVKATDFADALTGAALASETASPVVLVGNKKSSLDDEFVKEYLYPSTEVIALGGEAVLKDASLTPYTLKAVKYDKDEETKGSKESAKPEEVAGNVDILGNNITVQNQKVAGNVYVEGNKASLKNVDVDGTIFVNPGKDGEAVLENVKADRIKVLSGAEKSIHLDNVTVDVLEVNSMNAVKIDIDGSTKIKKTVVTSAADLNRISGSFGEIEINNSTQDDKVVELSGKFENIGINADDTIVKINDHVEQIEITKKGANLVLEKGASVNKVVVREDAKITMEKGSRISSLQAAKGVKVTKGAGSIDLPKITEIGKEAEKSTSSSSSSSDSGSHHHHDSGKEGYSTSKDINIPYDAQNHQLKTTVTYSDEGNKISVKINNFDDVKDKTLVDLYSGVLGLNEAGENKSTIHNQLLNVFNTAKDLKADIYSHEEISKTNAPEIKEKVLQPFGLTAYKGDRTPKSDYDLLSELRDYYNANKADMTYAKLRDKVTTSIKSLPIPQVDGNKLTKVTVTAGGKTVSTGSENDGLTKDGENFNIEYDVIISKIKEVTGYDTKAALKDAKLSDLIKTDKVTVNATFENGVTYTLVITK